MSYQQQRNGQVRDALVHVKSGLESGIYVALLINVLSRVMPKSKGEEQLAQFSSSQPSCCSHSQLLMKYQVLQ